MDISIKHNIIRSTDGRIKFKQFKAGGREQFHLGIWVDADTTTLEQIKEVEYILHPSFVKRTRTSRNRNNNFSVTFWTWGQFKIAVIVHTLSGDKISLDYDLKYELPKDDGTNYVDLTQK